jgi:hypothetical protein
MAIKTPTKSIKPAIKEGLASWDLLERMFNNVNALDYKECWLWETPISPEGYGIARRNVDNKLYGLLVHRVSYYFTYGAIPKDMVVDHSCHNPKACVNGNNCQHRRCYNPYHLRLITRDENIKIGANVRENIGFCRNNLHPWTEENVITYKSGKKMCIPCQKNQIARKREEKMGVR